MRLFAIYAVTCWKLHPSIFGELAVNEEPNTDSQMGNPKQQKWNGKTLLSVAATKTKHLVKSVLRRRQIRSEQSKIAGPSATELHWRIEQLETELDKAKKAADRSSAKGFVNLVSRYLLVGGNVSKSTENLIRTYKRHPLGVHDKEIAEVVSALIKRVGFAYWFAALIASVPAFVVGYQACLQREQMVLQREQMDLQREQMGLQMKQFALLTNEKKQELVSIADCSVHYEPIELYDEAAIAAGQPLEVTPGRHVTIVVSNNTRMPVVISELHVDIMNKGGEQFTHPKTYTKRLVRGQLLNNIQRDTYYLNPGTGGNDKVRTHVSIPPRETARIDCFMPIPFVDVGGETTVFGYIKVLHSDGKESKLYLGQLPTPIEPEMVLEKGSEHRTELEKTAAERLKQKLKQTKDRGLDSVKHSDM